LIIPISPESPATAFGTQYTATITPENSTIFAFDIPYTYTGTCALIFLFPFGDRAQFPYTFSGIEEEDASRGGLDFALLNGEINDATTFNSLPPVGIEYGMTEVLPGNNYTIAVGPCGSGEMVGYEVSSVGGVVLEYFQSIGGSPIGLWVVPCL
jgi:Ubiquitin 3 binding protein But2 C-terminal domain